MKREPCTRQIFDRDFALLENRAQRFPDAAVIGRSRGITVAGARSDQIVGNEVHQCNYDFAGSATKCKIQTRGFGPAEWTTRESSTELKEKINETWTVPVNAVIFPILPLAWPRSCEKRLGRRQGKRAGTGSM